MKLFLVGLLCSASVLAAPPLTSSQSLELNKGSVANRKYNLGTNLYNATQLGTKGTWNYSVEGGAVGSYFLKDKEGRKISLPAGAVVTNCLIDVVTQPTSANGNSATLAFTAKSAGDLKAAATAGSYTTSARIACIPDGAVANMIKFTSEGNLEVAVASEAVTAGKINVWVEYVLSE